MSTTTKNIFGADVLVLTEQDLIVSAEKGRDYTDYGDKLNLLLHDLLKSLPIAHQSIQYWAECEYGREFLDSLTESIEITDQALFPGIVRGNRYYRRSGGYSLVEVWPLESDIVVYVQRPFHRNGDWFEGYYVGAASLDGLKSRIKWLEDMTRDYEVSKMKILRYYGKCKSNWITVNRVSQPFGSTQVMVLNDLKHFFASESIYRELDIPYRRGVLLAGPPGNGKTSIVRWLTNQVRELYSKDVQFLYWELSKETNRDTLDEVSSFLTKPTVLMLEDVESIQESEVSRTEFLNMLDGVGEFSSVYCVATTNYPEKLDPALQRAGRLDRVFRIDVPSESDREAYFKIAFSNAIKLDVYQIKHLVEVTGGYSYAALNELRVVGSFASLEGKDVFTAIGTAIADINRNALAYKRGDFRWGVGEKSVGFQVDG